MTHSAPEPSSKEMWLAKEQKYLWRQMAPSHEKAAPPMVVAEANGPWIYDIDGKRYLDGMSGLWCVNLGYGEEALAEAAYAQMKTMPYYPLTQSHLPAIQLSETLNEWLGGDYKIFFSNSGSEANESAFKIARQYHAQNGQQGRFKFISRYRAYHGNTNATMAATGQAQRKYRYEPLAPGFIHLDPPYCYRCPFGKEPGSCQMECAQAYEEAIQFEGKDTVAAVILEPVITGGGMIVPPEGYLRRIREICDRFGVLMIVDEVICGFGRSGKPFGHMNYDVKPDIVTMAKGLTSGYLPLSATAVRAELFEAFKGEDEYAYFRHVNTFGGNATSCALSLRVLEIMKERNLVKRAGELGARLRQLLTDLESHPNVGDIRSFGFLTGIELVEDKTSKKPADKEKLAQVIGYCKANGLIIGKNGDTVPGYNNILTLSPPFIVSDEELDFMASTLKEAISTLTSTVVETA